MSFSGVAFVIASAFVVVVVLDLLRKAFAAWPQTCWTLTCVVTPAVIITHANGYKLYGSASVVDNRPTLTSPHILASLAAPNVMVTTDGSRLELRGLSFTPRLLEMPPELVSAFLNRDSSPLFIEPDARSPSGVVFQRHLHYTCGNTFFAAPFPQRLPRHAREDLGHHLIIRELAIRSTVPETF